MVEQQGMGLVRFTVSSPAGWSWYAWKHLTLQRSVPLSSQGHVKADLGYSGHLELPETLMPTPWKGCVELCSALYLPGLESENKGPGLHKAKQKPTIEYPRCLNSGIQPSTGEGLAVTSEGQKTSPPLELLQCCF